MNTADFNAWLQAQQQAAIDGRRSTTGDAFGQHCNAFTRFTSAIDALFQFEVELSMRGAS